MVPKRDILLLNTLAAPLMDAPGDNIDILPFSCAGCSNNDKDVELLLVVPSF